MKETKLIALLFMVTSIALCHETQTKAEEIGYASSDEIYQQGGIVKESSVHNGVAKRYLSDVQNLTNLTAEDVLYQGLKNASEIIDLTQYKLTPDDLQTLFSKVLNDNADLFYVGNRWSYYPSGGYVTRVLPTYTMSGDELQEAKNVFDSEIQKILKGVNDSWSDLEKALYFNDYICTHFAYDTDYQIYDAYGFLTQKKGVCQAYTLLYGYLLKQEGIESTTANSSAMNHIWNVVSIDGNWYHVDVTWNDPLRSSNDIPGYAGHENFLRNDTGIGSTGHYSWVCDVTSTDTKFENAFWTSVTDVFVYEENQWYYLQENRNSASIHLCDINALTVGDSLYTITDKWMASGGSYWVGAFSGFGGYDGKLYFNTPDSIYAYDIQNHKASEIYTPPLGSDQDLYGCYLIDNVIYYCASTSPTNALTVTGTYVIDDSVDISDLTVKISDTENWIICSGNIINAEKVEKYLGTTISVWNGDTLVQDDQPIATGYILQMDGKSYTLVIKGDVNGDSQRNIMDMQKIQRSLLQIENLSGVNYEAARVRQDRDSLSILDMQQIQRYILQLITIL